MTVVSVSTRSAQSMEEADVGEGEPRQQHGGEQEYRGHQLGRARPRGRLLRLRLTM
jgi:hypothetical protein